MSFFAAALVGYQLRCAPPRLTPRGGPPGFFRAAPPPVRGLVGVASRRDVAPKARVCVDETFRGARGTVLQAVLGCVPPSPWSLPADSGQAAPSTREVPLEEPRAF